MLLASSAAAEPQLGAPYVLPSSIGSISSGGGSGGSQTTPGGVSSSVQFNNGTTNSLGGDSTFTYLGGLLTVPHISTTGVSVTGPVSASTYYGDGSHLTGISGGSSTTPALPTNSIQFNNAGAFGGSSNLTFNGSLISLTGGLTATGIVSANSLDSFFVSATSILGATGTYTGLTVGSLVASGNISASSVSATSLAGTLTTASQPNVNSMGGVTFNGTITPTFYGVDTTNTASTSEVLYVSGTRMDGGLGLCYNNVSNSIFVGTPTGGSCASSTASSIATLQVSGTSRVTGNASISGTLTAQNVTVLGTCTNCGTGGGGGTAISTTTFTATTNAAGSTDIGFNAAVGTGGSNSTFGVSAGTALTSGVGIDAYGFLALANETNGNDDTAFGTQALQHQNGASGSVGFGASACQNATSGQHNTCIGFGTGTNIATGSNNVFLGYQANNAADVSNFMNLDSAIYAQTTFGVGFSQVGVNVTSPTGNFEVSGTMKLDTIASNAGTNPLCWSSTTKSVTFSTSCTVSDERLKTQINDLSIGLETINQLHPVSFYWKPETGRTSVQQLGFVAQDVQAVIPQAVFVAESVSPTMDEDGHVTDPGHEYLGLDKEAIIPVMAKAIQELSAQNNALEQRVETLEKK